MKWNVVLSMEWNHLLLYCIFVGHHCIQALLILGASALMRECAVCDQSLVTKTLHAHAAPGLVPGH